MSGGYINVRKKTKVLILLLYCISAVQGCGEKSVQKDAGQEPYSETSNYDYRETWGAWKDSLRDISRDIVEGRGNKTDDSPDNSLAKSQGVKSDQNTGDSPDKKTPENPVKNPGGNLDKLSAKSPDPGISGERKGNANQKGYDLPIGGQERADAERDLIQVMDMVGDIYINADKGNAENAVISRAVGTQIKNVISATGRLASDSRKQTGMDNYEKMEQFLNDVSLGAEGEITLYLIMTNGGIARQKFTYDGRDMYSLYTIAVWNKNNKPVIVSTVHTRIKRWEYTKKGWFCFEYCVPEPPEVNEIVPGNVMIRVKPYNEEYLKLSEKYLLPVGYLNSNLFRVSWDEEHMEALDYTGLFDTFYAIEYGENLPSGQYRNGIPENAFESLIMKYLPVTREQLKKYAVYDEQNATYEWYALGCGNFSPTALGASFPEVTDITRNADGVLTMTVDAVSESSGDDHVMTHKITVQIGETGKVKYLSNQVIGENENHTSVYQYRIPITD